MINAFIEGSHAANKNKSVLDNPYEYTLTADPFKANLWESGFMYQLEQEAAASWEKTNEAEEMRNAR